MKRGVKPYYNATPSALFLILILYFLYFFAFYYYLFFYFIFIKKVLYAFNYLSVCLFVY
jgi:hypothetical protein